MPAWDDAHSAPPGPFSRNDEPAGTLRGWQRGAAHACDERAIETHLADLSPASRALLLEVRARWDSEAATFLRLLARARAAGTQAAWVLRWSGVISIAAQSALAATFLQLPAPSEPCAAGTPPALHEVLADLPGPNTKPSAQPGLGPSPGPPKGTRGPTLTADAKRSGKKKQLMFAYLLTYFLYQDACC